MPKTICSLIYLLSCFFAEAQFSADLSIGPDIAFPSKASLGSKTPVSLGGSVQAQFKFNAPVGVQIHAGYNQFKDALGGKVSFLPVRGGVVGYLYQDLIYVYIDAGVSFYKSSSPGYIPSGFSFGAGAGYKLSLSEKQILQISAYLNRHNYRDKAINQEINYNWINLRIGYGFSFNKKKLIEDK